MIAVNRIGFPQASTAAVDTHKCVCVAWFVCRKFKMRHKYPLDPTNKAEHHATPSLRCVFLRARFSKCGASSSTVNLESVTPASARHVHALVTPGSVRVSCRAQTQNGAATRALVNCCMKIVDTWPEQLVDYIWRVVLGRFPLVAIQQGKHLGARRASV